MEHCLALFEVVSWQKAQETEEAKASLSDCRLVEIHRRRERTLDCFLNIPFDNKHIPRAVE